MTISYKQQKELNEFQIKRINKMLKLNFFEELDKLTDSKIEFHKVITDQLDILTQKLESKGIMFYSFVIKIPFIEENKSDIWESLYREMEEFLNFMGCHIELIEFCYMSIEVEGRKPSWKNKNKSIISEGLPYLIGIFGVRSLLGRNENLILEFKELFMLPFYDIEITWLKSYKSIIEYWKFLIKEKNFKFHRFVNFSNFFPEIYGSIADSELKFENRVAFGQENHFISETMHIPGINSKKPNGKVLFLFFINLYFIKNNYKIYDDVVFSKVVGLKYSWEPKFKILELEKNINLIIEDLKMLYPQQLGNFDPTKLVLDYCNLIFEKIKKNNVFLPKINGFDFIVEFSDGIYLIEKKKFLLSNNEKGNLNTMFFIKGSYSELNSNQIWLNAIFKNLNNANNIIIFKSFRQELEDHKVLDFELLE